MKKQPVVFDIDGTLTCEHCSNEELLTVRENPTMMLLAIAMQAERPLVISTARSETIRPQTEKWLAKHGLKPAAIYMREEGRDNAADQMVKFGHLQDIRKKFGDPIVWVDDNDANIRMLEKNDVPVIHVKQ